jgi:hypothetical protein
MVAKPARTAIAPIRVGAGLNEVFALMCGIVAKPARTAIAHPGEGGFEWRFCVGGGGFEWRFCIDVWYCRKTRPYGDRLIIL